MGLLDSLFQDDPTTAGVMGLLSASGPSMKPVSLGQALSQGYASAQQMKDHLSEREMAALRKQMVLMQMHEMQQKMADESKVRDFFADPSKFMVSPASQALANGQGPTNENASSMSGLSNQFDAKGMYQAMLKSGSTTLGRSAIEALAKQEAPKLKSIEKFEINGKVTPVQVFENGAVKTMNGFNVPPEIIMQNLGNRVVAINKNNLQGGENLALGVSPDAQLSANVSMRGQNMTDARSKEANGKPSFHEGQWMYPPSQGMPQGAAITPPGVAPKMTEAQSKDTLFGSRAARAHEILTALESGGVKDSGLFKSAAQSVPVLGGVLGNTVNVLPSALGGPNQFQQQTEQARRDFINAVLRKESGAVISPEEFASASQQYFPLPGDSDPVLEQKRKNRELAVQGISLGAGSGQSHIASASSAGKEEGKAIKTPSKQFKMDDGTAVIGTLGNDGNYYVTKGGKKYRIEE